MPFRIALFRHYDKNIFPFFFFCFSCVIITRFLAKSAKYPQRLDKVRLDKVRYEEVGYIESQSKNII